ncbi:retrovirus-related pol polyprotein from transposon TNT 1-94 [Tanacetum coccineum]
MEAVWIMKFISGLGIVPTINEPIGMFCDNSAALYFANEPGVQNGTRHYHRRYHYVRERIALGEMRFLKVYTDDNLADPFTKALPKGKLTQHARSMGLHLEDDEFELLFGEGPSQPIVEESPEDSLIEEVVPVKRKYVKRRQSAKKNDKDVNEPWTPEEEVALCDEKVEETQPVDRDKTKRMGSTSAARSASSSAAADTGLVDTLLRKFTQFSRKKHGYRSYEDDVAKISISIYVSNLPETFSAKDLFHACNKYGHVVDSSSFTEEINGKERCWILSNLSMFQCGKMLVGNLCTVWVGRYKLQANKARFGRPPLNGRNIRNSKSDDRHLGGFKEPNVRHQIVWIAIEGSLCVLGTTKTLSKFVSPWGTLTPVDLVEDSSFCRTEKVCVDTRSEKNNSITGMRLISFRGLGQSAKKQWIRELNTKNKINFVAIQETKRISKLWDTNSYVKDKMPPFLIICGGSWHLKLNKRVGVKCDIKSYNVTCFSIKARLSDLAKLFDNGTYNEEKAKMEIGLTKPCKLYSEKVDDLECDVTFDEIKKAVWDCGTNKSPGPDGFSFDFIRTFWDILKHDFVNAIREFFISKLGWYHSSEKAWDED